MKTPIGFRLVILAATGWYWLKLVAAPAVWRWWFLPPSTTTWIVVLSLLLLGRAIQVALEH